MSVLSWLLSLFSRKERQSESRYLERRDVMPLVERAVLRMGLIKPEFIPKLTDLVIAWKDGRPDLAVLYNRKQGTQLSDDEKKALGIRKNAFFSHEVLAMLTDAGRREPMAALPMTMNRISGAMFARRDILNAQKAGITKYRWRTTRDADTCRVCKKREAKLFAYPADPNDHRSFPGACEDCLDESGCRCYAEAVVPGFTD